jgi:hypothetical protein
MENDEIDSINFLKEGAAAFVIPLSKNLIFTEINEGDEFGQLDLFYLSVRDS